jgi:autotransporter-associated beta strand protein
VSNLNSNGPGAFVSVAATIDGSYYGLVPTTANTATERLDGNLSNGTEIQFFGQTLPTGLVSGTKYYVLSSTGVNFQVSLTLDGAAVNLTGTGLDVFFIETDKLNAEILVKDEASNPEWNGVYRVAIDDDNSLLAHNVINFVRVSSFDTPAEMLPGVRVLVQNGTSSGKSYFLTNGVSDLNVSAVHWSEDGVNSSVSLLASVAGLNISNAIDVNAFGGNGTSSLGVLNTVTSGSVNFTGPVTLQNQLATKEEETLILTSSLNSGAGLVISGTISEADGGTGITSDKLSIIKTGPGITTLTSNNTFGGGITINEGTLLVMNTPSVGTDSGTGTGAVTVNAGAVLGGIGTIAGPVTLTGTLGTPAVLRPGDPNSAIAAVETLTINQPLTVGANVVLEFTLGATNFTKLAGSTINLSTSTSRIIVQLESGYIPANGTEFDILDFNGGGLSIFGGIQNLLNLLQLPAAAVWDTTQFATTGKLIAGGAATPAQVTDDPDPQVILQGGSATFSVGFSGTAPVTFQWMKDGQDILGGTNSTLTISGATQASEGQYTVRVMNPANPTGDVSDPASLQVDWHLSFASNLQTTKKGSVNDPVTFKVVMNGESPTYQWRKGTTDIPGETSATYTIPSVGITDAGNYSVVVTNPFGSITSNVSVLSVTEGIPVVIEQPDSLTVLAGTTLALTAQGGGGASITRTVQWLRNGTAITGATSNTLNLPNIPTASAGEYTFRVTNIVAATGKSQIAISNPPASIVVVENPFKVVAAQIGKTAAFTVIVGSPTKVKPTFEWLKNGGPLPLDGRFTGGTTKTLTIKGLTHADTDTYTCRVTGASGTAPVVGGTHFLRVYDAAPQIETTPPPRGIVGGAYAWKIPVKSDVTSADANHLAEWKKTPTTYAVTGLPAGLKVDAVTGVISGYPTTATAIAKNPNGYPIKITVSNAVKPNSVWDTFIDIKPLPAGIVGSYAGPIQRSAANGNLGGRFEMTVLATGAFSGKVFHGGASAASPFKGGFDITLDGAGGVVGLVGATVKVPATATVPELTLNFDLQITPAALPAAPTTLLVNATVTDNSNNVSGPFTGWRNKWASKAVEGVSELPFIYQGSPYNFAFALPTGDPLVANPLVPQGAGYASFTVSNTGAYTVVGRTADGEKLTGGYWVGPTGQLFFFQSLYTTVTKGSILGNLQIETATLPDNNDISGDFTWVRPPTPASVSAKTIRLYRSGFGTTQMLPNVPDSTVDIPVGLVAFGGRYIAPPTKGTPPLKVIFGLDPSAAPNALLNFSETGTLPLIATQPGPVVTEDNPYTTVIIGPASKATTPAIGSTNPAGTTVTPTAATGAYTGKFTLSETSPAVKRIVTFQGLILRRRTSTLGVEPRTTETYGLGYFIIDQLPGGGTTTTTSPQLSGLVNFQKL